MGAADIAQGKLSSCPQLSFTKSSDFFGFSFRFLFTTTTMTAPSSSQGIVSHPILIHSGPVTVSNAFVRVSEITRIS